MTAFLYTLDSDLHNIETNAGILLADDMDTLTKDINSQSEGVEIVKWVEGSFPDCWVKQPYPPEIEDDANGWTKVDGILCHVQEPGTHPGGKVWRLTPVATVMVPIWECTGNDEEEDIS